MRGRKGTPKNLWFGIEKGVRYNISSGWAAALKGGNTGLSSECSSRNRLNGPTAEW